MATERREFSRKRLRGHRNGSGLSRAEVAEATGRSENAIKSYEDGVSQPTAGTLAALADTLGVAIDDLYTRYEDPVEDYVDAVASHCRLLTDTELEAAAVLLRRINPSYLRGITGTADPDESIPA